MSEEPLVGSNAPLLDCPSPSWKSRTIQRHSAKNQGDSQKNGENDLRAERIFGKILPTSNNAQVGIRDLSPSLRVTDAKTAQSSQHGYGRGEQDRPVTRNPSVIGRGLKDGSSAYIGTS